jgi:hypothetical protein
MDYKDQPEVILQLTLSCLIYSDFVHRSIPVDRITPPSLVPILQYPGTWLMESVLGFAPDIR